MIHIIIGSILLSLVHAVIPNHWIPIVLLGKSEHWTFKETTMVAAVSGFAHVLSTIVIGMIIGLAGIELAHSYEVYLSYIAPSILIGIGLFYLLQHFKGQHSHEHVAIPVEKKSKRALIISLCIAMFFSPCLEVEAFYFNAATHGWAGILTVSAIYLALTVVSMTTLVGLGFKGMNKLNLHFLEHYEKAITGGLLIIIGIFSFFVHF